MFSPHNFFKSSEKVDCSPDKFKCNDNKCINARWKCDRDLDCADGSDEDPANCQCQDGEFKLVK